jgi:hypothetical protein
VFWLTTIFFSFGLLAPPNATVMAALFICALSVAGAIFLIVELNRPFEGLLRIPSEPLRTALGGVCGGWYSHISCTGTL